MAANLTIVNAAILRWQHTFTNFSKFLTAEKSAIEKSLKQLERLIISAEEIE